MRARHSCKALCKGLQFTMQPARLISCPVQATLKFIEMKLRAPVDIAKNGKGALTMETKSVIIRVLQRFQTNVPQDLRSDVAMTTRLALTGQSGRFPEDIETEASDRYKEVRPVIIGMATVLSP